MIPHDDLSQEELEELFRETIALLAMLTHPDLYGPEESERRAAQTFGSSPPHALVVLASIGAGRLWRLPATGIGSGAGRAASSPREVLQTVPSNGRPDLLLLAIDLLEAVARGVPARPLVDHLLVDGITAYRTLLAVVHEVGWLAARADPDLRTLADLIAVESAASEADLSPDRLGHP